MSLLHFFSPKKKAVNYWISVFVFLGMLVGFAAYSSAKTKTLMIRPFRIIFADRQRLVKVSIANPTDETISYSVAIVTMRKGNDGKLRQVKEETDEEKRVREMIRFSPRRAIIEPGKRQIVKLMVRKPKDLPVGEYRTRLKISPLDSPKPATTEMHSLLGQGGSNISMDFIISSTFPVFIQHGDVQPEVTPQRIRFKEFAASPSGIAAEVTLARKGIGSGFGNISLWYLGEGTPPRRIGRASKLTLYAPYPETTLTVPLKDISSEELTTGKIRVEFQSHYDGGTKKNQKKQPASAKEISLPLE